MSSDTDLYLLPATQNAAAAAREVIAPLLRAMGISRIEEATVYSSGEWEHDAGEQSARHRNLSVDAFRDLCNQHAGEYVMAHVDSPFLAVAQNIVTRHPDAAMEWRPYDCLLHVGPHSLPDREFEQTIWRGVIAVSLHGDRIPLIDELLDVFGRDPEWMHVVSAVERAIGTRVETRFIPYY